MRVVVFGLFAVSATACHAVDLIPDTWVPLPGTTSALRPETNGVVVEDVLTPFSMGAPGSITSGQVQNRVVLTGAGTYDFEWRVFNDSTSVGSVNGFRLGSFYTGTYDADWFIDGLGDINPSQARLFSGTGGNVNFDFSHQLATGGIGHLEPGTSSKFFFLHTDAKHYDMSGIYDLTSNSGITGIYSTFAPSTVPEPCSMIALGLGSAALLKRRRKG